METSQRCPQCGGGMRAKLVGNLKDKWLECGHCGHSMDVPDASEVTHVEEFKDASGNVRKVWVSHRREDLGAKSGLPAELVPNGGTGEVQGGLSVNAKQKFHAGVTFVKMKEGQVITPEDLKAMIGRGELNFLSDEDRRNFEQLLASDQEHLSKELNAVLNSKDVKLGEVRVTKKGYTTTHLSFDGPPGLMDSDKPSTVAGHVGEPPGSLQSVISLVKWLVVLGCVVALIILLMRN